MRGSYNQLTGLGQQQAMALGQWWAANARVPDQVYVGPQPRQQQTRQLAAAAAEADGSAPWPDPVLARGFDEHDGAAVALGSLPDLAAAGDPLATRLAAGETLTPMERARLFRQLMTDWVAQRLDVPGTESFQDFRVRVSEALTALVDETAGLSTVVVFTSAGTIGAAASATLSAPDEVCMELSWSVLNTSVTEFRIAEGHAPALMRFNATPHLTHDQQTFI